MIGTAVIRDCIRAAKRTAEIPSFITQGSSQYGMQSFDQCLLQLYRDGIIAYETAKDSASSPDDFDLKVRGIFSTGELTFEAQGPTGESAKKPDTPPSPFARR